MLRLGKAEAKLYNVSIDQSADCLAQFPRWVTETIFDILTEVGLFAVALVLVQGLHLNLQKKFFIMLAFWLRLP